MTTSLDVIRLDLPCQVPWETMAGDGRVRFCTQCDLHVHNLSAMTEPEAAAFLATRGERVVRGVPPAGRRDGDVRDAGASHPLPVMSYETPRPRRRWVVPAALAGAVAAAGRRRR
jgi:hypothetical protein